MGSRAPTVESDSKLQTNPAPADAPAYPGLPPLAIKHLYGAPATSPHHHQRRYLEAPSISSTHALRLIEVGDALQMEAVEESGWPEVLIRSGLRHETVDLTVASGGCCCYGLSPHCLSGAGHGQWNGLCSIMRRVDSYRSILSAKFWSLLLSRRNSCTTASSSARCGSSNSEAISAAMRAESSSEAMASRSSRGRSCLPVVNFGSPYTRLRVTPCRAVTTRGDSPVRGWRANGTDMGCSAGMLLDKLCTRSRRRQPKRIEHQAQ